METYEAIDRLCEVAAMLSDLVREQAAIIAQADIPDETKSLLAEKRENVGKEFCIIQDGLHGI